MWDWLKFSFRVWLACSTVELVIWLVLMAMLFTCSSAAWLLACLLEVLVRGLNVGLAQVFPQGSGSQNLRLVLARYGSVSHVGGLV